MLEAGCGNIDSELAELSVTGWASLPVMATAIALVSYFSGPMLNYGDFRPLRAQLPRREARQRARPSA